MIIEYDPYGHVRYSSVPLTINMTYPVECGRCRHIHDSAKVEVTGRYTDCDMWKCPSCGGTQDNRWDMFPHSPSTAKKLY